MNLRWVRFTSLLLAALSAGTAHAQYTWTAGGANDNWNNPANWTGGPAGTFPNSGTATATFNGGANTPIVNVAITVGTITKATGGTTTISATGGSSLTIANGITRTAGTLNISAPIVISTANETWSFGAGTHTFSGNISGQSFNRTGGGGVLILSGTNSFAGATVTSGTLRTTSASGFGSGTITLAGGTLSINSGGGLTLPITVVTSASSTFNVQGGGQQTVANLTVAGGTTLTLTNGGGSDLAVSGTLNVLGTVTGGGAGLVLTVNGTVTGTGTVRTLTLGAGANFTPGSGGSGTLSTGGAPNGNLTLNNTTNLNFTPGSTTATINGNLALNGVLNISGSLTIGNYVLFNVTGTITNGVLNLGSAPTTNSYAYTVSGGQVTLNVLRHFSSVAMVAPRATHDGRLTRVTWTTGSEDHFLGFRLWRQEGNVRVRVTPGVLGASTLGNRVSSATGHSYGWDDRAAPNGGTYWIEALDVRGRSDWYGPVTSLDGTPSLLPVSAQLVSGNRVPLALVTAPASDAPLPLGDFGPVNQDFQVHLAGLPAAKISVHGQGYFRVPAEQLFAAGIARGTPATSLALWAAGQPVWFNVNSANGATLEPGDAIEFYGLGLDTFYSAKRVYWLTSGFGSERKIRAGLSQGLAAAPTNFSETREIRERETYLSGIHNGVDDKWAGEILWQGLPVDQVFTTTAIDPLSSESSTLEVAIQGTSAGPHHIDVLLNGVALGSLTGLDAQLMRTTFTVPSGMLVAGDNHIQLVPSGTLGDTTDHISWVIYQRLTYPRLYARAGGPLQFTATGQLRLSLTGFDATTQVLDITDPAHPAVAAAQMNPSTGELLVLVPGEGTRLLYAFQTSDVQSVDSVKANTPSSWHGADGADFVIIGHSSLLPAIQPLVDQRRSEGLRVAVVDVEDVYDEFASGEKSASAIKDFLSYAHKSWKYMPSWVLLVGKGTYDPRGFLGSPDLDFVPVELVELTNFDTSVSASDDVFVNFDGQGPEMAIGRLPLRSATDVSNAVTKILGRKLIDADSTFVFVQGMNDDVDYKGDDFGGDTSIASAVLAGRHTQTISNPDGGAPDGGAIISAFRSDAAVLTYQGHGKETYWWPGILTTDDLPALANSGQSGALVAGTCENGHFFDISLVSLAEGLLGTSNGGSWAVWSSTGQSTSQIHGPLSAALLQAAAIDGFTLGEATLRAKAAISDPDVRAIFHLFGDPTARLAPATDKALSTPSTAQQKATGCTVPGDTELTVLPLVALALLLATRARRRTAAVRIKR